MESAGMGDRMINFASAPVAADHCVAAEGLQPVKGHVLPVASIDLEDHVLQERVANAVIEASRQHRRVAERVHPETNGSGGEYPAPGHVLSQPMRNLVLDRGCDVDPLLYPM